MPTTERIDLINLALGDKPFVLIEAEKDPDDGELVLSVNAGGGAEEQIAVLPFLLLEQTPADENPITEGIALLMAEYPDYDRETLVRLAKMLGIPMPEGS